MEYINKMSLSTIAPADTAAGLFVDQSGVIGGDAGVAVWGGKTGELMEVVTFGVAKVQLAASETVSPGDYVKPDSAGKAVKDNLEGKFLVLESGTTESFVSVVLGGPTPKYAASGSAVTSATGEIAITGMTATGQVLVAGLESTANAVNAVAGTDKITVYDDAAAVVNAKKVAYIVLSFS